MIKEETKQHLEEIDRIAKDHLNYIVKLNSGAKSIVDNQKRKAEMNKKVITQFESSSQSNFLFSNDSYVDALSSDEDNK